MLRKRLEQYFASEGSDEPRILEIPKGNYAPVFRERPEPPPVAPEFAPALRGVDRRVWALAALSVLLACSTAYLLATRPAPGIGVAAPHAPTVRLFWSQVFRPGRPTDVVLDDATVALYQEMTGKPLSSSEYSDKSYI